MTNSVSVLPHSNSNHLILKLDKIHGNDKPESIETKGLIAIYENLKNVNFQEKKSGGELEQENAKAMRDKKGEKKHSRL